MQIFESKWLGLIVYAIFALIVATYVFWTKRRKVTDHNEIIERLKMQDAPPSVDTKSDSINEPLLVPSPEELERWEVVWLRGSVPPRSVNTRNLLRKGNFVMLNSGIAGVIEGFLDRERTEVLLKLPGKGMKHAIYPRDVQYIRIAPSSGSDGY